jgi:hypothetical protein
VLGKLGAKKRYFSDETTTDSELGNKALVGAGSNKSQYAPSAFFLKLSNIELQFIPGWPTMGW